jgi:uncharacterized protein (DUF1697 family)
VEAQSESVPTHVALLRGVNVGGHGKLAMPLLREVLQGAGCRAVATYVQSGNAVFLPPVPASDDLAGLLRHRLAEACGFDVPVMVRQAGDLDRLVAGLPFTDEDPTRIHVAFLDAPPAPALSDALAHQAAPSEQFEVSGCEIYLHLPDGMGRARMPRAFARAGAPPVTVRNWRTVLVLAGMTGQDQPPVT